MHMSCVLHFGGIDMKCSIEDTQLGLGKVVQCLAGFHELVFMAGAVTGTELVHDDTITFRQKLIDVVM